MTVPKQVSVTDEVCPSCGAFVEKLISPFGWCIDCSLPLILGLSDEEGGRIKECEGCGKPADDAHRKCRKCRDDDWLAQHADEIDRCLANGLSLYKARIIIAQHYRANGAQKCLCCEGPMRKAAQGQFAYFCGKPRCRTAQNRLRKLIYSKGFSRNDALQTVLEELKG